MNKLALLPLLALLSACAEHARLPAQAGTGADPELPQPNPTLIPTVEIAPAVGWTNGATPTPPADMQVTAFAQGLDHPRWLYVLPNGDVLVAETNAPPGKSGIDGIKGWMMKRVMKRAGAAVPSANRITLLRDTDGDGKAEFRSVFLEGLHSPFGMALIGDTFYVANADALLKVPYQHGETTITAAPTRVADLPGKGDEMNHHWTKSLLASADGAFVGLHGSWNRRPLNGYQVVFVPFTGGRPTDPMRVVLSGFLDADGNARGRPVGVSLDGRGGLLVADDIGNSVWRVSAVRDLPVRAPGQ